MSVSKVVWGLDSRTALMVCCQIIEPPSFNSSLSTDVITACFTFINKIASATRFGSCKSAANGFPVATGKPLAADLQEPKRVAEAILLMKVKHAVITSVDRDELKDGGSIIWQQTINAVRESSPGTTLETLIPDFKAEVENIQRIIGAAWKLYVF